jgi:flagellar hook-associated protein 2
MSYIDGLATGLNTSEIIKAMMDVEAIPKVLMEQRVATVQAGLDAFASIRTKTSALRTAADAIGSSAAWRALTATSSDTAAVSVTAGTGAASGSLSFSVVSLARAMTQTNTDTFAGANGALEGRTLEITKGDHTFNSTATTLDALVAEINADTELGVRASTIQVQPGQYQLVLRATQTGTANEFTVGGTGWTDPFAVTTAATNAVLDVGGITVTRSSNTISDLVDHTTITLKAETTSPVTVNVERDVNGIATKVKALVDALNGALGEVKLRTAYDAENNRRSSLTGDSTARSLAQSLTSAMIGVVSDNPLGSVGLVGIELKRDGTFAFDEAKFKAAFAADPAAVQGLFTPNTATTAGITFETAGWRAQAGTHAVELRNVDGVWSARIGGENATVTVNDDGSLRLAVAGANERMGGMTVKVSEDTAAAATDSFEPPIGSIVYAPGAARRLTTATNRALDAVNGTLTTAEQARSNRIKDLNRQIGAFDIRLEKRELRLRQQYTALESLMGQLGNQATWLSGQIAGLQANMGANRK